MAVTFCVMPSLSAVGQYQQWQRNLWTPLWAHASCKHPTTQMLSELQPNGLQDRALDRFITKLSWEYFIQLATCAKPYAVSHMKLLVENGRELTKSSNLELKSMHAWHVVQEPTVVRHVGSQCRRIRNPCHAPKALQELKSWS